MAKFLVLYRSTMHPGEQMGSLEPEQIQAEMQRWNDWGAKAGAALVDFGNPTMPTDDADPGPAGWVGGYSILEADDAAGIATLLVGHPHLDFGTIEVLQLLDMPGA
jgi:hypothetical protein